MNGRTKALRWLLSHRTKNNHSPELQYCESMYPIIPSVRSPRNTIHTRSLTALIHAFSVRYVCSHGAFSWLACFWYRLELSEALALDRLRKARARKTGHTSGPFAHPGSPLLVEDRTEPKRAFCRRAHGRGAKCVWPHSNRLPRILRFAHMWLPRILKNQNERTIHPQTECSEKLVRRLRDARPLISRLAY
jgi:hypothetical protein